MGVTKSHPPTLCWECKNTNRFKCPWFNPDNPQPVPGWTAEKQYKKGVGDTYYVTACPNFLPVDPRPVEEPLLKVPKIQGVRYNPWAGKWLAEITRRGKYYYLGQFSKREDAIAARRAAEVARARGEEPRRNK